MPLRTLQALAASIALRACVALAAAAPGAAAAAPFAPGSAAATPQAESAAPPSLDGIRLETPRPIRAATAMLGMGRQRLALVVGLGKIGARTALDSAARDVRAVAGALAAGGYLVMRREDVAAAELRAALAEFRARLQPEGLGFVYVTGLGAQLGGGNLLLARDARLEDDADAARATMALAQGTVPIAEVIDALQGTADSPRLLAIDAAYAHPALARLQQPGLAEPRLPPGMMALFSQPLGAVQRLPAVAPLPDPPPTNPRELAASHFARALLTALAQPRTSGPAALRATQRSLAETAPAQAPPWLGGSSDEREEFAELTILDALLPRSAEEATQTALEQLAKRALVNQASGDGAKPVAEVLQQARAPEDATQGTQRRLPQPSDTARALGHAPSAPSLAAAATGTAAGVAEAAAARAATGVAAGAAAGGSAAAGAAADAGSALSKAAKAMLATERKSDGAAAADAVPTAVGQATIAAAPPSAALAAAGAAIAAAAPVTPPVAAAPPQTSMPPDPTAAAPDGRTVRAGERGERPLYTPRTNAFGYAEGDTFAYRVVDTWKGEVSGGFTHAVEEVLEDGRMLGNGGQLALDAEGRLRHVERSDGSRSDFEPHEDSWWAAPRRGEQRDVQYIETFRRADGVRGSTEWSGSASVGRARRIETPAGAFDALPIESDGWWTERIGNGLRTQGKWSRTVWYAPSLGHPVAIELQLNDPRGRLLHRERAELTHAQTSRTVAP